MEHLGPALAVVDGQLQHHRDRRGEDPPEVVLRRLPFNDSPEQFHARAEHHLELWVRGELTTKRGDRLEGGREVRIPEGDIGGPRSEGFQDALPDGLSLADIAGQAEGLKPQRVARDEGLEQLGGTVRVAVIHEQEGEPLVAGCRLRELCGVEPPALVVAGNHGNRVRGVRHRALPHVPSAAHPGAYPRAGD